MNGGEKEELEKKRGLWRRKKTWKLELTGNGTTTAGACKEHFEHVRGGVKGGLREGVVSFATEFLEVLEQQAAV